MKVTKAYDFKELMELSREKGGPAAEKALKANWEAIKEWVLGSSVISENKIDDVGAPLAINTLDPLMSKVLDQVDGELAV